jgi:hypothetical protein
MADPYLGNGVQLTSDGALTLKGVRSTTWPGSLNIADKNGLRVDTATGNAWVHPPHKAEARVLGLGATAGFTPSTTTRVPGGGFLFAVGQGDVGDIPVTAGTTRPTNNSTFISATTATSVSLTNTQSTTAAVTVIQTGTLGTILTGSVTPPLAANYSGSCGIGTRAATTVGGVTYNTYNEYFAVAYNQQPIGGITTLTRTDLFSVAPGGTVSVSFSLYYRGELPAANGGAQLYYGANFCFVFIQQDRAFSTGDA